MSRRVVSSLPAGVLAAVLSLGLGLGAVASQESTPGATPAVERDVLTESEPEAAPGQVFEFARYTIPPQFALPVHTHPGIQMAIVISGTLTYHVIENGSITVNRADGTLVDVGPGETVELNVGDAWAEPAGMVHYAENLTDEPVILLAASLLDESEPAAIPVDEATPAA